MYIVLNCHNVAKHSEFYLGQLWLSVTSTGIAADYLPVVSYLPYSTWNLWRHFCYCGSTSSTELNGICRQR
jgi:hypothetical protein